MTVQAIREEEAWQGKRMTRQRRMIFENISARKDHPDVETLCEDVRGSVSKLSLQTVYRTVNLFEKMGLVQRVATWQGRVRYDANVQPHIHFLCECCGTVQDVDTPGLGGLDAASLASRYGSLKSIEILITGSCHPCLAKGGGGMDNSLVA